MLRVLLLAIPRSSPALRASTSRKPIDLGPPSQQFRTELYPVAAFDVT